MNKYYILLFFLGINCLTYAQTEFQKGYFIDDFGNKKEILIKNEDWKFNPSEFTYKTSENSEAKKAGIDSLSEFGVYNYFVFEKHEVDIDRSKTKLQEIDENRHPVFNRETLFLRMVIDGKAKLYSYEEGMMKRFFFSVNDSEVKQLVYKQYLATPTKMGENQRYKQQLLNALKCKDINMMDIEKLSYKEKRLVKFFSEYNICKNSGGRNFSENRNRDFLNLTIRPGLAFSNLNVDHLYDYLDIELKNNISYRFGIELEYILPFNNDKWGVFIEPTYQSYNAEGRTPPSDEYEHFEVGNRKAEVKYNSFEIPVGIRYYMFFNEKSQLFINAAYVQDLASKDSGLIYEGYDNINFQSSSNFSTGLGYKLNNSFVFEARYSFNQDLSKTPANSITYNTLAFIVGYNFL